MYVLLLTCALLYVYRVFTEDITKWSDVCRHLSVPSLGLCCFFGTFCLTLQLYCSNNRRKATFGTISFKKGGGFVFEGGPILVYIWPGGSKIQNCIDLAYWHLYLSACISRHKVGGGACFPRRNFLKFDALRYSF